MELITFAVSRNWPNWMEARNNSARLDDLLKTAWSLKDKVLYVWGGGWNEEDNGGGDALHLGILPEWKNWYEAHKDGYDFEQYRYQIHQGLDCSGYISWVLYNIFPLKTDYVVQAEVYASHLASLDLGTFTPADEVDHIKAGDILSTETGHVILALGEYPDGSRLLLHASPPGVRLSGTKGQAYQEALRFQKNGWDPLAKEDYLHYDRFRFHPDILLDPNGWSDLSPDEIAEKLDQLTDHFV